MENWAAVKSKYQAYLRNIKFMPGDYLRAETVDGDIFEGRLSFVSNYSVELQDGDSFRSFNRSNTKLQKILNPDRE